MAGIEGTHKMGVDMAPSHDHIEWQVSQADSGDPSGGTFGADPYVQSHVAAGGYGVPGNPPSGSENASQGRSKR